MQEVKRPLLLDTRAAELLAEAEEQFNEFQYGNAYDSYIEAVALIQERGGTPDIEINFMIARCISEMGEPENAVKYLDEMIDMFKDDTLVLSRTYYERGLIKAEHISVFDGLIDFDLAIEHLAGEYAPKHKKLGKPLTQTLVRLSQTRNETLRALINPDIT